MNAKKDCELCKGTGWYGDSGAGRNAYNREVIPCECTEFKPQMKTYEITFEEFRKSCLAELPFKICCNPTNDNRKCTEENCPIIKKLKEVKDGDSQIDGIKNRISEITKVLDGKMKRLAVSARMANGNHAQEIYAHFKEELRWLKADIEKIIDEVKK
jgi:hypothetical protein